MTGLRIAGWGASLPSKVLTNADLEAQLDTSDAWIRERTGIRERRIGDGTAAMAIEAGSSALRSAGVEAREIDLVILCTTTPDQEVPATSAHVQEVLGIAGGAMDLNAACAGFVYGLITAQGLITTGMERILLIGADSMSRLTDWSDRNTAVLFGDGAGAVVLERCEVRGQLLASDLGADGAVRPLLYADRGGKLQMEGKEVFRRAVRVIVDSSKRVLASAELAIDDIDLLVPHQANQRIIDAACKRLGLPLDKAVSVVAATGNTSAASIPLALVDALDGGRVKHGDHLLLTGFGAGMTWASAILHWV